MSRIQLEHVTYEYESRGDRTLALNDVSLTIESGEFVCLVGHSGCGKTTLLNLIAGLTEPSSGMVLIDGEPVKGPGIDRNVIFQHYSLFPWLTAEKNVAFGIRQAQPSLSSKQAREKACSFLDKVELGDVKDKYPFQLSGGMQQRVAIARAFAMNGPVMLLDEPFGALDPKIRATLQQELEALWQKEEKRKTIVFVTHDINEAVIMADRIIFMKPGRIHADIPVKMGRPRREQNMVGTAPYCNLRSEIIDMFYSEETTG